MPAWTKEDQRQYEAIRDRLRRQGMDPDRAVQIAARTVNKQRRLDGRTENVRSQGTGNPHKRLDERTRDELYNRARQLDIPGRGSMRKSQLVEAIRRHNFSQT